MDIGVASEILGQATGFSYLEHVIRDFEPSTKEIKMRVETLTYTEHHQKDINTVKEIQNCYTNCDNKVLYRYASLLSAAESWTMKKQLEDQIEAIERGVHRRIVCISCKQKQTEKNYTKILLKPRMKRACLRNFTKKVNGVG